MTWKLQKCKRLRAGIAVYVDRHGVDPTPFLCDDHMSDEASGPDSSSEEDIGSWQQRMADALDIHSEDLSTFKFLEVIRPEWRSEQVSRFSEIVLGLLSDYSYL